MKYNDKIAINQSFLLQVTPMLTATMHFDLNGIK